MQVPSRSIMPLYDQISLLVPEENLFCIQENGLYGVVDLQGEVTIDATYDYICYDKYADYFPNAVI